MNRLGLFMRGDREALAYRVEIRDGEPWLVFAFLDDLTRPLCCPAEWAPVDGMREIAA